MNFDLLVLWSTTRIATGSLGMNAFPLGDVC